MQFRFRRFASALFALALVVPAAYAGTPQEKHPSAGAASMAGTAEVPAWLVGTWTLVRCDNVYPDGHRVELYGPHPQGLWMIDGHGHYLMHIARVQRTPFAAGDKSKGTAEEYRAASLDSNSHFGSIRIEDDRIVTHIDQASFPNWNGRDGKSSFTRDGKQLTYIVAKPSSGSGDGAHGEVVWQRID